MRSSWVNRRARPYQSRDFPTKGSGYWFLMVRLLSPRLLIQSRRLLSGFLSKRMRAPSGDLEGLIKPLARLVLM